MHHPEFTVCYCCFHNDSAQPFLCVICWSCPEEPFRPSPCDRAASSSMYRFQVIDVLFCALSLLQKVNGFWNRPFVCACGYQNIVAMSPSSFLFLSLFLVLGLNRVTCRPLGRMHLQQHQPGSVKDYAFFFPRLWKQPQISRRCSQGMLGGTLWAACFRSVLCCMMVFIRCHSSLCEGNSYFTFPQWSYHYSHAVSDDYCGL